MSEGTAEMRKGAFYIEKFTADNVSPLPRIVIKTGLKDEAGNKKTKKGRYLAGLEQRQYTHI